MGPITTFSITGLGGFVSQVAKTKTRHGFRCFVLHWYCQCSALVSLSDSPLFFVRRERHPRTSEQLSPLLTMAASSSKELDVVWREAVILFIMESVTASCVF